MSIFCQYDQSMLI